jgi:adenine/guanine phosphoribosyltransferase-like PRPP-binding protein
VLVFDDSVTTGARSQSAAAALRMSGAHVVGILVVGRAHPPAGPLGGPICNRRLLTG